MSNLGNGIVLLHTSHVIRFKKILNAVSCASCGMFILRIGCLGVSNLNITVYDNDKNGRLVCCYGQSKDSQLQI